MATICMSYCINIKNQAFKEHNKIISIPKTLIPFTCQSSKSGEEASKAKKEKQRSHY
ncbi:Glycerol kinase [Bienertia sinuspersici]